MGSPEECSETAFSGSATVTSAPMYSTFYLTINAGGSGTYSVAQPPASGSAPVIVSLTTNIISSNQLENVDLAWSNRTASGSYVGTGTVIITPTGGSLDVNLPETAVTGNASAAHPPAIVGVKGTWHC